MPARAETVAVDAPPDNGPPAEPVEPTVRAQFDALVAFVRRAPPPDSTFLDFERALVPLVLALGRELVALFLRCRHEETAAPTSETIDGKVFTRSQEQDREIGTYFGKVRYWRTYMRGQGGGYYPLDRRLKLPQEGFSLLLIGLVLRVATKMSYAQTRSLVVGFVGWSPSVTTIEKSVLGVGRFTTAWFEQAPAPDNDGDWLIIMVDSKATPTATEHELKKRRRKRPKGQSRSGRHRGRKKRKRWQEKKRRKKGDHTKNGRAATLVVMYTLRSADLPGGKSRLEGPLNRRVYASYSPKRHAFAIAARDAARRGFGPGSGKRVQIVIDGDRCLADYAKEFFPDAVLTLDVIHAVEYLWKAGRSFYREGSKALADWVKTQKTRLLAGKIKPILKELREELAAISTRGPGNKGKRKRLTSALGYLTARVDLMNYDELLKKDLEISSGAVEGAVRYVIGQRFDTAGMRWITERSEALLQLRCIEINGHWNDFVRFVESRAGPDMALLAKTPAALPRYGLKDKAPRRKAAA